MDAGQLIKLSILALYLLGMLAVGFFTFKQNENFQDYVLGGRKLGKWTTALSAQASDMSGWLMLGLPGAAYLSGLEAGWIAIGLGLGTWANWRFVAKRLRIYTEECGNSLTLPDYFENRFEDTTRMLRLVPALVIIFFFTIYTAAQFSTGAKLFEMLLGIPYRTALMIGCVIIIGYTFLGGFLAVSLTDVIQGMLMFFALIIVPGYALVELGGFHSVIPALNQVDPHFLDFFQATGSAGSIAIIAIISNLAWGLGYCGQPHILVRFMAINNPDELKSSRRIACGWVAVTLVAAILAGTLGRIYFQDMLLDNERVFMLMVDKLFPAAVAGIFLAAILASSMSTADSQLLVTASSISEDIYAQYINKDANDKKQLLVGRIAVAIVAVIAIVIAWDPNSSVFGLVSNAWAGLGASFGPVVLFSLLWKNMNRWGAMAGMVSGAVTVIVWNGLRSLFPHLAVLGVYELLPAFAVSVLFIIFVSKSTGKPSQSIINTFEAVQKRLSAS